jgi:CSLREA domain-containing protein
VNVAATGEEVDMRHLTRIIRVLFITVLLSGLAGFAPFPSPAVTINVTTFLDEYADPGPGEGCSLREAITAADTDLPFGGCLAGNGVDTINLLAGTYTLTRSGIDDTNINGDLDIYSSLTLTGGGMDMTFIDAAHIDRVIHILGAYTVNLNNLTLQNGHPASGTGGGLQNDDGIVTLSGIRTSGNQSGTGRVGGGIGNNGTMALEACLIDGNAAGNNTYESWAGDGGGIANWSSATMTIDHSIIRDNQAGNRSEASADTADIYAGHGGGIFNSGSLSIDHSLIWNNHAGNISGVHTSGSYCVIGGWGGGIGNLGVLTVMNSTIYANTSGSATAPAMYCSRGGNGGAYWGLN